MTPAAAVFKPERQAPCDALAVVWQSWVPYAQAIANFGPRSPLVNIVEPAKHHFPVLRARTAVFRTLRSKDHRRRNAPRFSDLPAACAAAVQDKIDTAASRDPALQGTRRPAMAQACRAVCDASRGRHLPAFRRRAKVGGR